MPESARLGVHEKTIMKTGGWRIRSVFDGYNIVDEKDLAEAAALLDEQAQQRNQQHSSGTATQRIQREERERHSELI